MFTTIAGAEKLHDISARDVNVVQETEERARRRGMQAPRRRRANG